MERLYDLITRGSLLFLVVFPPLAFGGVYYWGIAAIEVVALLMLLTWALRQLHLGRFRLMKTPLNLPILLFLGFTFLQLLPLPPIFLSMVSPQTYALYQRTLWGWPGREVLPVPLPLEEESRLLMADRASGAPASLGEAGTGAIASPRQGGPLVAASEWRPLSVYPYATMQALWQALAYAGVFLIVVNTVRTRSQLRRLLLVLMSVAALVTALGIAQRISGTNKMYWLWPTEFGSTPFGPYVSRNHFAGFLALLLPLGLGWLWGRELRGKREAGEGWQAWLWGLPRKIGRRWWPLACSVVVMGVALLLSASRGGILSATGALICFSLLVWFPWKRKRGLGIAVPCVLVCILAGGIWLGLDQLTARAFRPVEGRVQIWAGTYNLLADYPLWGTGLGTYVYSFRRHNPVLRPFLVDHAHNDYLELLAETGAVGFLVVMVGLGWFSWRTLRRWYIRHDPEVRGVVLGGLAGMLAIGIHSLVDFNLHIPANAMTLAVVLGLVCVAVHLKQEHRRSVVVLRVRQVQLPHLFNWLLYPVFLFIGLVLVLPVVQGAMADQAAQTAEAFEREVKRVAEAGDLVERWGEVAAWKPRDADYQYRLGRAYELAMQYQWDTAPMKALEFALLAMEAYREGILRNPTSPFPFLSWSWSLESASRLSARAATQPLLTVRQLAWNGIDLTLVIEQLAERPERTEQWGRKLVQTAIYLAPTEAFAHYSAGLYTLQRWEKLSGGEQTQTVRELRLALQLEPRLAQLILESLWQRTQDRKLVLSLARGTREESHWRVEDEDATLSRE